MDKSQKISVLLSFQNQRNEVEPTLSALYELESVPFELFIIDDASTDGTGQAIQSLLDYYQHDQTFFFDHAKPMGRGNSLNEMLQQANHSIVWAPSALGSIQEPLLYSAIQKLSTSDAACFCQHDNLPATPSQWLAMIRRNMRSEDGSFLWNMNQIKARQRFFNPHLNRYLALEWMARINPKQVLHATNPFFAPLETGAAAPATAAEQQEFIVTLLRWQNLTTDQRKMLIEQLHKLPEITSQQTPAEEEHNLLDEATALIRDGQLSVALEKVEHILDKEPRNSDAKQLKIQILERKRRFVEASELKHELQADTRPKAMHASLAREAIKTSLIIPTALHGKPALEHCLLSVAKYCNPSTTEVIVIDNASLDDTSEYLQEMHDKNFFNCSVITNEQNKGFAASINQGLEATKGRYACILHNDIEFNNPALQLLEQLMDEHSDYALLGPLTDSTLNPDQLARNKEMYSQKVIETDYLDSFCMMIRTEAGITMDEAYTLAFFEDIDFSFQVREAGFKVGIAPEVQLSHHYGTTTFALDLDTESDLYWKNIAYFNDKWSIQRFSREELQDKEPFEQLLILDDWVNPVYPEAAIKKEFEGLFTDELKTEMLKMEHNQDTLHHLVHLMMVMEKRDVMRQLEDRLDQDTLPAGLIYETVRFYFKRNIYSRCIHYLDLLPTSQESLQSELYRLAILIDEKKIEQAVPKLTELLEKAPSNPLLYKLAGDIHTFDHNRNEAKSFYKLAHKINPFDFPEEPDTLQVKK